MRNEIIAAACAAVLMVSSARAQDPTPKAPDAVPFRSKTLPDTKDLTFRIASGPEWSTEYAIAQRIAQAAMGGQADSADGAPMKMEAMTGDSGAGNLDGMLSDSTIDLAFVPKPLLVRMAKSEPYVRYRLAYIAPQFLQEVHVVAKTSVASLADLKGRKVVVGRTGDVGTLLFGDLGIDIQPVDVPLDDGMDALKAGRVDAVVAVSGAPIAPLARISSGDGLHAVTIPYDPRFEADFLPASLSPSDYPGLVESQGQPTLAVQAVLMAYVWPKQTRRSHALSAAVKTMLDRMSQPGWNDGGKLADVNWNATLPDWTRLTAAQAWLRDHARQHQAGAEAKREQP